MMWIAIFSFILLCGYFIYGKTLEKNWEIDIYRDQSSWQEDENVISHFGFRYLQLAQFAMLFSFEMLISVVYGYAYGLAYVLWITFGSIFFGGALSYYGGMYALRNRGYTLNYIIKQKFGSFIHLCTTLLILSLIAVILSDSYKSFSFVYQGIFDLPQNLLLVYCVATAMFFCFCPARQMAIVFSGIGIFAIVALGFLLIGSKTQLNLIEYGAHNFALNELKYAYPLAFFVITLGSINCLQGLQASLLAPMITNEKVGRRVFFGAAIFQGLFLLLGNALVAAWNPEIQAFYNSLFDNQTPYVSLQNIAYNVGGKRASLLLFALAFTVFLGFVGSMARLARNLLSETKLGAIKYLSGIFAVFGVIFPVFVLQKFNLEFKYVLICTQLVGIFSCLLLAQFLRKEGKKYYHLIWPAVLVFGALVAYIMLVLLDLRLWACYLSGFSLLLLSYVSHIFYKNREVILEKWQQHKEKTEAARKIRKEKAAEEKLKKEQAKKLKQEEKERLKLEKEERKKQENERRLLEQERKKQASLSLMVAQDETGGKEERELSLEKEIAKLQAERDKIDLRVKEIEQELEKEQSKRLLVETSESVVEQIQKEEESSTLINEMKKLDEVLQDTDNLDINNLIDEKEELPKETENNTSKFDFDTDLSDDFEFESSKPETVSENMAESKQEEIQQTEETPNKNKKKRRRNRHKKSANQTNQAN